MSQPGTSPNVMRDSPTSEVFDSPQAPRHPSRLRHYLLGASALSMGIMGATAIEVSYAERASAAPDFGACPNGGVPLPATWHDKNSNGGMDYGEVACWDEEAGRVVPYIPPEEDSYGTNFQINREPSSLHIIEPQRLVDTRQVNSPHKKLGSGKYLDVAVVGGEVPTDASSVYLTVTIAGATNPGYVTAYPTGTARPETSSLNANAAGEDIANLVNVPVGQDGKVRLYSSNGAHLIVDVVGYFKPATNPEKTASAGRYEPRVVKRLEDTRQPGELPLFDGEEREVYVGDFCDPNKFGAILLNATVTRHNGNGYLVVFAGDEQKPKTSNVNFRTGQDAANGVIVAMSPEGTIKLEMNVSDPDPKNAGSGDVLLDGAGCITNDTAPQSQNGMFRSVLPVRLLDTRSGAKMKSGDSRYIQVEGRPGFDFPISAVVGNVTGTQTERFGYVTVDSQGNVDTSALNLTPGLTKANGVAVPNSQNGDKDGVFVQVTGIDAHVIFDATGGFIAAPEQTGE